MFRLQDRLRLEKDGKRRFGAREGKDLSLRHPDRCLTSRGKKEAGEGPLGLRSQAGRSEARSRKWLGQSEKRKYEGKEVEFLMKGEAESSQESKASLVANAAEVSLNGRCRTQVRCESKCKD